MLFPESRRALELIAGETPVWTDGYDIDAARAQARATAAAEPREDVAEVRDLDADGVPGAALPPRRRRPTAVVVHLHGGGFVFNDVDVHDAAARRLANRTGMSVLSVDYRRPPEHRFPAAPDDVSTVVGWLDREAAGLGLSGPTYVHGDSAGGNLALVAALRHPGRFAAAVLIYPFLDPRAGFDSYRTSADGFDPREAAWYWEQYAARPPTSTTPTSRRCCPTGSRRCRRPWWSPPSTTRSAARGSTSPACWPTPASRSRRPATSVSCTGSGGTPRSSRRPRRCCARPPPSWAYSQQHG